MAGSKRVPERAFFDETAIEDRLLYAALLELVESGYGEARISRIAARAGVSKQRALYHFRHAEEVLLRLIRHWGDSGRQVTLEHLAGLVSADPRDRILGMVDGMFLWMKKYPYFARLTPVILEASSRSPAVKEAQDRNFDVGRSRIQALLSQTPGRESLPPASAEALARSIHCLMIGTGLYLIGTRRQDGIEEFRHSTLGAIRALLG